MQSDNFGQHALQAVCVLISGVFTVRGSTVIPVVNSKVLSV